MQPFSEMTATDINSFNPVYPSDWTTTNPVSVFDQIGWEYSWTSGPVLDMDSVPDYDAGLVCVQCSTSLSLTRRPAFLLAVPAPTLLYFSHVLTGIHFTPRLG